jgi:hypothetical protein
VHVHQDAFARGKRVRGFGLGDLDHGERSLGSGELDDLDGLHRLTAAKSVGRAALFIGFSALLVKPETGLAGQPLAPPKAIFTTHNVATTAAFSRQPG